MQASTIMSNVEKNKFLRSAEHVLSLPGRPIHLLGQRLSNNTQLSTAVEVNFTWAKNNPQNAGCWKRVASQVQVPEYNHRADHCRAS